MDRSWTGCILYRSLQMTLWPTRGSQKVERISHSVVGRSCDFCDGANRTASWHWPQCERYRSGSARIACCLRGKAAISQCESALETARLRDCETAQAAKWATRPEPLLSKRRIGPPRCAPRKVDPRIPPKPPHCPTIAGPSRSPSSGHVPHPIRSPKYTMLISILHPSSEDATCQVGLNTSNSEPW